MRRNPLAAETSPSPTGALQYFTDRERYLRAFHQHLETPEDADMQALVFYGVGGIGKTTLVQKLCAELDQARPPIPYARFNLDNIADQTQASREVLLRLRSDLENGFHLHFSSFDLALAVTLARDGGDAPAMVKLSPGLGNAFEAALEFTPSFVKASVKLLGGQLSQSIQKSEKLEQWVRHVGGTEAVISLSQQLMQDEQIIQEELIRRFAQDLAQNLPARPGKACRGVLFLDTYEALWTGRESGRSAQARLLDEWVRTLAEYGMASGVLLVITGRDRLDWADEDPEWNECLEQHLLGGVSAKDAQDFLSRREVGPHSSLAPDPLQEAILRCANAESRPDEPRVCHLLTLALCADIVLNTRQKQGNDPPPSLFSGIPTAQAAAVLATRFLKSLHNRNLELWVEALSLTPRFNEKAALALDRERLYHNGRAGWEQLTRYSFVAAERDGFYRMNRTMREALRARVAAPDAATQQEWFRQHWEAEGEAALAFYHRWRLEPEAAVADWSAEHRAAMEAAQIPRERLLLTRWAEIDLDCDDRRTLTDPLWAQAHLALGQALWKTSLTPRQEVLRRSAQHFESALTIYTEDAFPLLWADTQMGLALCLIHLPGGDRAGSLHRALRLLENALGVYSAEGKTEMWADAQNHLGIAHAHMPEGDPVENYRQALACFEASVAVWSETEHPKIWARGQHNLGVAYIDLPGDNRAESLHRAAGYLEAALRVRTEDAFPSGWALTRYNLGLVHLAMPGDNRAASLPEAISHFEAALRVYTQSDFPELWAETQNKLGAAWCALPGESMAHTQCALAYHTSALEVWNEQDAPGSWASAQYGSGDAHRKLAALTGDAAHSGAALECFRAARRGFASANLPEQVRKTDAAIQALSSQKCH